MNTLSHQPDPDADEQASLWAARLEGGTLSATDRDALDAWLNAHASHRPLLSRYCQFSTDLEEQLLSLVATGGVKLPPESDTGSENIVEFDSASAARGGLEATPATRVGEFGSAPTSPRRRWSFPMVASVAFAAAAAVAVAVWVARPTVRVETIATTAAQRSSITLTDGTRVELNARTSFTFENGAKERRLKLAGGEAFFTVAKDKARPFIIDTPAGSVRVTGTVFNVRADQPAHLEVAVVEGSVDVRPGGPATNRDTAPFSLGAKDYLTVVQGQAVKSVLSAVELDDLLAWRQGAVVFHDVPLQNVLKRFADYHGKTIYHSAAIEQLKIPVKGRFSIDDLEGSLETLSISLQLQVDHATNGTIRVKLTAEQ